MNFQRFKDKTVLITGASSGFGEAIARRLSGEGANVSLFARRGSLLKKIVAQIKEDGGKGIFYQGDVTDHLTVSNCVEQTMQKFGKIDILINNAGAELMLPFVATSEKKWKDNIDINLGGTIRFAQAVLPAMIKAKNGVIINISAVYGLKGGSGVSIYSMTKGGIIALTKSLAVELATRGIRVNAIAPGLVKTELVSRTFKTLSEDQIERLCKAQPLGLGSVDDITAVVAFIASDEAKWMTGSIVTIDGGASAK